MNYPSKLMGRVHFILLGISLIVCSLSAFATVFYIAARDVYDAYFAIFDEVLSSFYLTLNYMVIAAFMVWLFLIHKALRLLEPGYPVSPIGALLQMMPIIQIWGIGSTFSRISDFVGKKPDPNNRAKRISFMIIWIYVTFLGTKYTGRFVENNLDDVSHVMLSVSVAFLIAMYLVFLYTSYLINQYLYESFQKKWD